MIQIIQKQPELTLKIHRKCSSLSCLKLVCFVLTLRQLSLLQITLYFYIAQEFFLTAKLCWYTICNIFYSILCVSWDWCVLKSICGKTSLQSKSPQCHIPQYRFLIGSILALSFLPLRVGKSMSSLSLRHPRPLLSLVLRVPLCLPLVQLLIFQVALTSIISWNHCQLGHPTLISPFFFFNTASTAQLHPSLWFSTPFISYVTYFIEVSLQIP
jgi:hypothetical protein